MNWAGPVAQSGTFVASVGGSRFRLVSEPAARAPRGTVVLIHAFAEEMNKSRRMTARMARRLAGAGWRVVQRDLRGCGDSSGDFGDAAWEDWQRDVDEELAEASAAGPAWLWCERAGALLAPAALAGRPGVNLLLWQPVVSGAQHLQQFLRLHAGARIVGSARPAGEASPLQTLRAGRPVEVGGYTIHPALAAGLERASLDLPPGYAGRVAWFELSTDEVPALSPQASRMVDALRGRGIAVQAEALRGPAFWQTVEIEECEALLERSLAAVDAPPAGGARALAGDALPDRRLADSLAP